MSKVRLGLAKIKTAGGPWPTPRIPSLGEGPWSQVWRGSSLGRGSRKKGKAKCKRSGDWQDETLGGSEVSPPLALSTKGRPEGLHCPKQNHRFRQNFDHVSKQKTGGCGAQSPANGGWGELYPLRHSQSKNK